MHMGMMATIASHFTHSYNTAIHKTLMLVKAKVLGKLKGEMYGQQGVDHQTNSRPIQDHGS
jgi:hypothetical protein